MRFGWQFGAVVLAALLAAPAQAAPAEPVLDFLFEAQVNIGNRIEAGQTGAGTRGIVHITGGSFAGPLLRGKVLPGGWDWQLHTAGGCDRLHADYFLQTEDGALINVVNEAQFCPKAGEPAGQSPTPAYTSPRFEAPLGRYGWLNHGVYVSRLEVGKDPAHPAVFLRFYRVR